jgi:hypothetical protein
MGVKFQLGDILLFNQQPFNWRYPIQYLTQHLVTAEEKDTTVDHCAQVLGHPITGRPVLYTTGAHGFAYGWVELYDYIAGETFRVARFSDLQAGEVRIMEATARSQTGQFYGFGKVAHLMWLSSGGGVVHQVNDIPRVDLRRPFCSSAVMNNCWMAGRRPYWLNVDTKKPGATIPGYYKLEPGAFAPSTIERAANDKNIPDFNFVD